MLQTTHYKLPTQQGFSLVEVILSTAVFVLLVTALVGAYLYGQEATALAGNRARAVMLAEEGLEAVRNIRDENFSNLSDGTHGLAIVGNQWTLSGSSDLTDIFTRQIIISPMDANRKSVTANVLWQQNPQRTGAVSLSSYLTYWQKDVSLCADMASCLTVDISSVGVIGNVQVTGITLTNTNTTASSTIDKMTISWTGGAGNNRIINININGSSTWSGSQPSGTLLDITNFVFDVNTTYPLTYLEFSKNIKNAMLSIIFTMSDASTKTVTVDLSGSGGVPTTCNDYCISLGTYIGGTCRKGVSQCNANGETNENGGNPLCIIQTEGGTCCCAP